jgi:hypothetical protein
MIYHLKALATLSWGGGGGIIAGLLIFMHFAPKKWTFYGMGSEFVTPKEVEYPFLLKFSQPGI